METNKPKSRREQYQEKLKERELYSNNFLDRFTENGAGAPLRNNDGSIITKRRTMLNNDYEDIMLSQRNATPNPLNYNTNLMNQTNLTNNNNNIINNDNNNYFNNNFYQTLPNRNIDINNIYKNDNTNNINNENQNDIINNDFQMTNFHRRPQSQNNYNNTLNSNQNNNNNQFINRGYNNINNINNIDQENNIRNDPFGNNYQGTGIIPRDRNSEEEMKYKNQILRETWLKEIEEKRIRDAQRKKEQQELDLKYEERYRREIEEERELENLEKLKKKENEENARNINNIMIENNKKNRKNQNDDEFQNNMIMNGNNLEPVQMQNQNENQIEDEFNSQQQEQNFRILRQPNNDYINKNNFDELRINEFGLDSNPRELEDNINEQIAKLRNDVNSQYIEMSNLFGKLKMDVIEANQLKNEAEKELQYIKKELAKNKMASLAYDAQLNQVLERHAPYNNLHINIKDVDPLYSLKNAKKDLQSTSNMIYATDMINEQNLNRVKQLSALAQAGQNLVSLKAESEFIPISNPGENNGFNNEGNNNYGNELSNDPKSNIAISKTGYKNLESESYPIFQQNNEGFGANKDEPKILDDYMNKGEYSNMYKQLEDIANINHAMGPESKLKTLSKNYELDYKAFNEKHLEEQKKNISQMDQLLNELN